MRRLAEINEEYEQIMRSPSGEARDRTLGQLMTRLEYEYHIPALHNEKWEQKNRAVIALYRKISEIRGW